MTNNLFVQECELILLSYLNVGVITFFV